jgi:hypothetical protein
MEITYELNRRDFYESFIIHRSRSFLVKWLFRIMKPVAILMLLSSCVGYFFLPSDLWIRDYIPLMILAVFWMGLAWASPWLIARNQFLKQPSVQGLGTLFFDPVSVHWRWTGRSESIEWENIVRVIEGKRQFLFYASPAIFKILPKRALTAEQLPDFRALLSQYAPGYRKIS